MKIRKGFVTNSSSSSFILGFKSKDTVKTDLVDSLINKSPEVLSRVIRDVLVSHEADEMNMDDMCKYVRDSYYYDAYYCDVDEFYNYLRNVKKVDEQVILEYMSECHSSTWRRAKIYDLPSRCIKEHIEGFANWYADMKLKEFKKSIKGKHYFMQISYSDNNGKLDSELEHDVMPYLDCTLKTINNH